MGFSFFQLGKWSRILFQFIKDQKRVQQPAFLEQFLFPVDRIADSVIYLHDGGMRAVLRVEPIHFQSFHEHEKRALISAYRSFLNSLEFPIQILIQTKSIPVEKLVVKKEKKKHELPNSILAEYQNEFESFLNQYLEENNVIDRQFFLIIPYTKSPELPATNGKKPVLNVAKKDDLRGLQVRVRLFQEKLQAMGLSSSRLMDEELSQLLSNSFEMGNEAGGNEIGTR